MASDAAGVCLEDPKLASMRVSATYTACIYSVLVYDWLLSLPDEYKYIWRSKPTTVNGLYIILRYWPLVKFAISLYLSNTWMSYERCHDWTAFQVNSNLPITICVSTLLALRLYALYGRNIWLLAILGVALLAVVVVAGFASTMFDAPHFLNDLGPCFASAKKDATTLRIANWLGPFAYDSLCFVLLVGRVWIMRKKGASLSKDNILSVLVRDGLFYFAAISAVNLINVGFLLGAPLQWQTVNAGMAFMISALVSCRMALSLRRHANGEGSSISQGVAGSQGGGLKSFLAHRNPTASNNGNTGLHRLPAGYGHQSVTIPLERMTDGQGPSKDTDKFSYEADDHRPAPGIFIVTEKSTMADHARDHV